MRLNTTIKAVALQLETPKDLPNVVVRSGKGLRLAEVPALCYDLVVAIVH